ncbi:inorganic pyrophosphatase [Liberiplasma polymorphum]|jgi:inorganic pyrophosphatase|uniref:inorganic pyrophosphatase n=1 Tax=Liberiplasma polymorphum TaxID=3374570 RepID=UPI003773F3BF
MEELLGTEVQVVVDRPLGCKSPNHGSVYPINFGYLPKYFTREKPIKAYVIGEFDPIEEFTGYVVAIVKRINEPGCKVVVAKEQDKYTKEQIEALIEFRERHHQSKLITEKS